MLLAYLHPDPEVFCIPIVLIILLAIPVGILLYKLLPKDDK